MEENEEQPQPQQEEPKVTIIKAPMTGREKRMLNLRPSKKGEIRNPKGRPKLPNIKDALADIFGAEDEAKKKNGLEKLLTSLSKRALAGDSKAARLLLEYAYGKPDANQNVNLTVNQPQPVTGMQIVEGGTNGDKTGL